MKAQSVTLTRWGGPQETNPCALAGWPCSRLLDTFCGCGSEVMWRAACLHAPACVHFACVVAGLNFSSRDCATTQTSMSGRTAVHFVGLAPPLAGQRDDCGWPGQPSAFEALSSFAAVEPEVPDIGSQTRPLTGYSVKSLESVETVGSESEEARIDPGPVEPREIRAVRGCRRVCVAHGHGQAESPAGVSLCFKANSGAIWTIPSMIRCALRIARCGAA
jgi:hypothetical protein